MNHYQHLEQPMKVGSHIYKNRVIAAPLSRSRFALDGDIDPSTYYHLEVKAKGGAAEVSVGETHVDFIHANREDEKGTNYTDMEKAPSFKAFSKYAALIKKYNCIALCELEHCGNVRENLSGKPCPLGPVGFRRADGAEVKGMDEQDIRNVCENFATAARFMQKAGFDGALILAGHGWLIHQFLTARINTRTDQYGGCLENRARFPLMILRSIREACGKDFLIEVRVSAQEKCENGQAVEETAQFCKMMEGIADLIHVSTGNYHDPIRSHTFSSMYHPHGCNVELAAAIKKETRIPVAVVGGINDPAFADHIIAEGSADFVALGRQYSAADPEWANKAFSGRDADIAQCIRCYACFPGPKEEVLKKYGGKMPPLVCSLNPMHSYQTVQAVAKLPKPDAGKTTLVIGGGIAGMFTAITAADRGHKVTLIEKSDKLGGLLNFTDRDYYKTDLHHFKETMIHRINERAIEVFFNTEATPELIRRMHPDAVVIAVGSEPLQPPIPGLKYAMQALDVYFDDLGKIGNNVIIVGGGLVGCELGLHLAKMGKKITIVEMAKEVAADSYIMHRVGLLEEMDGKVKCLTNTKVTEISSNGIKAIKENGETLELSCDTVIYALGMKAKSALAEELKSACGDAQVFTVGDCVRARKVQTATEEGFLAGMQIH